MAANLLNNAQSEEVNEGNKKTSAERLSVGRPAAALWKPWSSAAIPRAVFTVLDLARSYSPTPSTLGLESSRARLLQHPTALLPAPLTDRHSQEQGKT